MKIKYTVVKNSDIEKHLSEKAQQDLFHLLETVEMYRDINGKTPNKYVVINTDEPYIEEIIEIMKKYGHWG